MYKGILYTVTLSLLTISLVYAVNKTPEQRISIEMGQEFTVKFTPDTLDKKNIKNFKNYELGTWSQRNLSLQDLFESLFTVNAIEKTESQKGSFNVTFKALNGVKLLKKAYFENKGTYEIIQDDK